MTVFEVMIENIPCHSKPLPLGNVYASAMKIVEYYSKVMKERQYFKFIHDASHFKMIPNQTLPLDCVDS